MKFHTEAEYINSSKHFLYRLKSLYLQKNNKFKDIQDYMPFPVYINDRLTHEYIFANDSFFALGEEMEQFYNKGLVFLHKISDLTLLEKAIVKAKLFHESNDWSSICNYLQIVRLNKKMTPILTNKILIDDNLSLNSSMLPNSFNGLEKIFKELIPFEQKNSLHFLRYQTLTKREKLVFELICKGKSNKQIAEILFNSHHTIRTHRNRIWKKLEIKHFSDCFKYKSFLF